VSGRPPRPDPDEPAPEETSERVARLRAELRAFNKAKRDKRLRQGLAKPRTYAEIEIFGADLFNRRIEDPPDTKEDG
jgi:hypothetical protein